MFILVGLVESPDLLTFHPAIVRRTSLHLPDQCGAFFSPSDCMAESVPGRSDADSK